MQPKLCTVYLYARGRTERGRDLRREKAAFPHFQTPPSRLLLNAATLQLQVTNTLFTNLGF